jgi:MFS family permease
VLGFGEGATFPAGLKTVTETLPAEQRSFGLGLAYSGGSLGALLTPLVIVPLSGRWGWRSTFLMSAVAGFLWIGGWLVLRSVGLYRPVARLKASERRTAAELEPVQSKWNRSLFATALVYGLGAAPLAFGLYAAPLYLTRILHLPQAELGHLLWVPPAGWEVGYLVWGRVADFRRRRALAAGQSNSSPFGLFVAFALGSLLLCLIPYCAGLPHAVAITMAFFFLVMFLSGGFVVIALASGATKQSSGNTGFLAGFSISGWSLTTGVLMWVVGRMFDHAAYTASFWLVAGLPCLGVLLWRIVSDSNFTRTETLPQMLV